MKIYCVDCKDQLTKNDDIIEVEIGFMHDSCYHNWLSKQHKKRMINYKDAVKKVRMKIHAVCGGVSG